MFVAVPLDLNDPGQAGAWLGLLDHYARDPMGGGNGLSDYARQHLVGRLQQLPGFHAALAMDGDEAVGLINCFAGFSTFAAKPLLNIHDIVVHSAWRGRGVAQLLLDWAARRASELDCCKLTLEVLANNEPALAAYARAGFAPYVLDPQAGHALFLQKILMEDAS